MSTDSRGDVLTTTVEGFAVVHLLTLGDRPRPHVGAVRATVIDGVIHVRGVGRTALRNAAGHNAVTLLWTPPDPDGYSLIVDGTATVVEDGLDVAPERAVLHRPAPGPQPTPGPCSSDCVELPVPRPRTVR